MLDVVRVIALTLAMIRSLRLRSVVGGSAGLLMAYGFAVIAVQVADAVAKKAVGGEYAMGLIFLGMTSASVGGNSRIPGGVWLSSHPTLRHVAFAALALVPLVHASRRSSRLRPESAEARRWDALGNPFVLLAVLELSFAVLAVLWAQLHWS
ncbi:MAG: hypothetical protein WBY94_15735 [Polyangiaceae bacterium]